MVFNVHTDPGNQGDMARILRGCISTEECSPDKRETNVRLIPSLLFLWARNSAGECSPCKREAAGPIPVGSTFLVEWWKWDTRLLQNQVRKLLSLRSSNL